MAMTDDMKKMIADHEQDSCTEDSDRNIKENHTNQ